MWVDKKIYTETNDLHVGFRGVFIQDKKGFITLRYGASSDILIWVDGELFCAGPSRFEKEHPIFEEKSLEIDAGKHIIAVHCHYQGVETRILQVMEPFVRVQVYKDKNEIDVCWKTGRLNGFSRGVRRLGHCLGFIEWCDKNSYSCGWEQADFDDRNWQTPIEDSYKSVNSIYKSVTKPIRLISQKPEIIASGKIAGTFGYASDDIPAVFFLRDLKCDLLPQQGIWIRYDLERIRLFYPRFVIDAPKGSIIEFAYSEYLVHDRVSPYITLMGSASCNLDHYIAGEGGIEYFPVTPRGGRFLEIHILCADGQDFNQIKIIKEEYLQRCGHDEIDIPFSCNNALLEKIWLMGAETYRSCAEDVIVDCPTRERGQWVGDNVNVGMNLAAALYTDISISKKGLISAAQSVRNDGLIPSNMPGQCGFLASFSLQWVTACVKYYNITGDKEILESLYDVAVKNLDVFKKYYKQDDIPFLDCKLLIPDGVTNFVDWGYCVDEGDDDIALNVFFYKALESMKLWCEIVGKDSLIYESLKNKTGKVLDEFVHKNEPENIEYHALSLLLDNNFIPKDKVLRAVNTIKNHILNCFPNNPVASRHAEPRLMLKQIITPYFAHFVFPVLIKHGEIEFVLQQYEACWGWMIENNITTCLEVFDIRWSHCHQWSASPTWQINKYILGMCPAFDRGKNIFDFTFVKSSLFYAKGKIPICGSDEEYIFINWEKTENSSIQYCFECSSTIWLKFSNGVSKEYLAGKHELIL